METTTNTATLMEQVLFEVKRVVVGQDRFLERVMVAMLAQGHVLVEHGNLLGAIEAGGYDRIARRNGDDQLDDEALDAAAMEVGTD